MQSKPSTSFPVIARRFFASVLAVTLLLVLPPTRVSAQRRRVAGPIDNSRRVALSSHISPRIQGGTDLGDVDSTTMLPYVTMVFKQSPSQEADLDQLLKNQQDPTSPDYHKWLTPEQFADRFGASQEDVDQVVAWLKQQGLEVKAVGRARNWVAFGGEAGTMEKAFATPIHRFTVDGRRHFANVAEPSIPAAFAPLVEAIHGLNDFRLHAPRRKDPRYNSPKTGSHFLAPDDVSTIYNIKPLLSAGFDGTGQKMVVVGQSGVNLTDTQQYRTAFGLPDNDPQLMLVPGERDPGIKSGDVDEANLDMQLAGAVARNATIYYVYSSDVVVSAQYAIDQNLAPVLSMSYGLCEAFTSLAEARYEQNLARQGNAQGITWVNASGDSGGADCVGSSGNNRGYGLQVDVPAAIPEVTGVGGTTFSEGSGNYWASTNSGTQSSALSYIPEVAWNDTALDGTPSSSGGGASTFWAKPYWQAVAGVPSDGARNVPDLSLSASVYHDAYMFYTGGKLGYVGGTSVGTPVFAGMLVLLNQNLLARGLISNPGLGNINPALYSMWQTTPGAFHDITTGDNQVNPCPRQARTCDSTPVGYSAGPGYDLVTGLGSVDAYNLVTAWTSAGSAITKVGTTTSLRASDAIVVSNSSATLTATVTAVNGGTPTGTVTFAMGNQTLGTAALAGSGGTAAASVNVNGTQLAMGTNTINAQYAGDGSYNASTGAFTVTVVAPPATTPAIAALTNAASYHTTYAPGMIAAVFGNSLAPGTEGAPSLPLPAKMAGVAVTVNGVAAPLFYVSPTQLNVQIPYETPVNTTVTVTINNNGLTGSTTLHTAAAAPGIFTDTNGAPVPNGSLARNGVGTLFITGEGAVAPALATGATPSAGTPLAALPKPTHSVSVTVGGVNADIQFIGIPSGLAGVTQINYQVPANAPLGSWPVVVTVGGVASPAATLMVTP